MVNMIAAQTYGEAIFQLAKEQQILEQIEEELTYIKKILHEVPELKQFVEAPLLPVDAKIKTLEKILSGSVSKIAEHFVYVMITRNRARCIEAAIDQYIDKSRSERGILTATVLVARKMSDDMQAKLKRRLEEEMGKDVILEFKEKPSILAGFIVEIGDRRFDASIARHLHDLGKELLSGKVSTKEIGVNESV